MGAIIIREQHSKLGGWIGKVIWVAGFILAPWVMILMYHGAWKKLVSDLSKAYGALEIFDVEAMTLADLRERYGEDVLEKNGYDSKGNRVSKGKPNLHVVKGDGE